MANAEGLDLLHKQMEYQGMLDPDKNSIFMVGTITQEDFISIVFGDEGQAYQMVDVSRFLSDKKVIPQLQDRLSDYLEVRA